MLSVGFSLRSWLFVHSYALLLFNLLVLCVTFFFHNFLYKNVFYSDSIQMLASNRNLLGMFLWEKNTIKYISQTFGTSLNEHYDFHFYMPWVAIYYEKFQHSFHCALISLIDRDGVEPRIVIEVELAFKTLCNSYQSNTWEDWDKVVLAFFSYFANQFLSIELYFTSFTIYLQYIFVILYIENSILRVWREFWQISQ